MCITMRSFMMCPISHDSLQTQLGIYSALIQLVITYVDMCIKYLHSAWFLDSRTSIFVQFHSKTALEILKC